MLFLAFAALVVADTPQVARWQRHEITLTAAADADPDTDVVAEWTGPSGPVTVPAFWDGGQTWRVRFAPPAVGEWAMRTKSTPAVPGLDGVTQTLGVTTAATSGTAFAQHGPLAVSGTHLAHADGTPFFWLGDTVWNGPLLASEGDWSKYLARRVEQRFTVAQFVMTAPWRTVPTDADGRTAYTGTENVRIDPAFFQRMDARMDAIERAGLLAAPVMLWAIKGNVNAGWRLPEADAIKVCKYLVARYHAHPVAWLLAGDGHYGPGSLDRDGTSNTERWQRIGRAVFPADRPHAPVTLHAGGMNWPFELFRGEPWFGFCGYQSGHGDDANVAAWTHSGPPAKNAATVPVRPLINLEPCYEGHLAYRSKKPFTDRQVRQACYWSLLSAPPAGVTYGGHGVWSWQTTAGLPMAHPGTGVAQPWHVAIEMPGANQMRHLRGVFEGVPWAKLVPAPALLAEQPGRDDPTKFVAVAEGAGVAVLYLPQGGSVTLTKPFGRGEWIDPRTGARTPATAEAMTWRAADASDWVLVVRE